MGSQDRFAHEFMRDAVEQLVDRGRARITPHRGIVDNRPITSATLICHTGLALSMAEKPMVTALVIWSEQT